MTLDNIQGKLEMIDTELSVDEEIERMRNLVSAVVLQALTFAAGGGLRGYHFTEKRQGIELPDLTEEAIDFILDDAVEPWSFSWCCDILDISRDAAVEAYNSGRITQFIRGFGRRNTYNLEGR